MATLAIDFDGVIHDPTNVAPGYKMGKPIPGAVEALQQLSQGNKIIIHTIWASGYAKTQAIRDWLDYFHIPFHDVTNIKPVADVYLDDKAIRFTSWDEALDKLS